jgi:hypothetical protein
MRDRQLTRIVVSRSDGTLSVWCEAATLGGIE